MKCRSSRWPRWLSARPQLQLRRDGRLLEPPVNGPVDDDDVSLNVALSKITFGLGIFFLFFSALLFLIPSLRSFRTATAFLGRPVLDYKHIIISTFWALMYIVDLCKAWNMLKFNRI